MGKPRFECHSEIKYNLFQLEIPPWIPPEEFCSSFEDFIAPLLQLNRFVSKTPRIATTIKAASYSETLDSN